MRRIAGIAISVAAVSLMFVSGLSAQSQPTPDTREPSRPAPTPTQPPSPGAPTQPPAKQEEPEAPTPVERAPEPPRVPEQLLQTRTPAFVGPDLFNPPAHQGWIVVSPSLTLSAEYNDNIFFDDQRRRSDVILAATPGVTLSMERPGYRLLAGYNIKAEVYLDNSEQSDFGKEQNLFADYFYQISPNLTFTLNERFIYTRGTNALTSSGTSAGFEESLSNTFTPGLRWQLTPNTALGLSASHTIYHFPDDTSDDSATYRATVGVDHRITARLSGSAGFSAAYLDFENDAPVWSLEPYVGLSYDVTPTLRVWGSGGPLWGIRRGDVRVAPAGRGGLTQTFKFGTVTLAYDRALTAESEGPSDRQAIYGTVEFPTLLRNLRVSFSPRYSVVDLDVSRSSDAQETVKTLSMTLQATYQLARGFSLIGSYTYYHESSDRDVGRDTDIDQNRVFFGVQYAYPITIY